MKYSNNKFVIDCLYSNIKSKKNGVLVKEGVCGLELSPPERYSDFIDEKIGKIEESMDSTDTNLILSDKKSYLPIIIYNSKDKLIYKLYNNKQALLNDDYSILSLNSNGKCDVFANNPWIIYGNKELGQAEIMDKKTQMGSLSYINQSQMSPILINVHHTQQ